jgi:DNA invertase Pin-like site-specific DNA recombinase
MLGGSVGESNYKSALSLLYSMREGERVNAGLQSARARGRLGGRPKALNARQVQMLKSLASDKTNSVDEICRTLKISRSTFYRYLKAV